MENSTLLLCHPGSLRKSVLADGNSCRNVRTSRYITFVTASSVFGNYLTHAEGFMPYLDDL